MINIFFNSLRDLFLPEILKYIAYTIIISALIWGIILLIFLPQIYFIVNSIPFVNFENINDFFISINGYKIYFDLILITSMFIISFISDKIVDAINEKYYHLPKNGFGSIKGSIIVSLKSTLIYILLISFTFFIIFIPYIGIIYHVFLWTILIKDALYYESGAYYTNKKTFKLNYMLYKKEIFILSFITSILYIIPVLGMFVFIYQLIIFSHFNLQLIKENKN